MKNVGQSTTCSLRCSVCNQSVKSTASRCLEYKSSSAEKLVCSHVILKLCKNPDGGQEVARAAVAEVEESLYCASLNIKIPPNVGR